jgi:hypothetical protein
MKIVKEKDGSYTFDGEGNTIAFPTPGKSGFEFVGFEDDKLNICNLIIIGESEQTRKIWNIVQNKTLKDRVERFFRKLFMHTFFYKKSYSHSSSVDEFNVAININGLSLK